MCSAAACGTTIQQNFRKAVKMEDLPGTQSNVTHDIKSGTTSFNFAQQSDRKFRIFVELSPRKYQRQEV